MEFIRYFSYYNPLKRGVRIALRSKVNDSLITGFEPRGIRIPDYKVYYDWCS